MVDLGPHDTLDTPKTIEGETDNYPIQEYEEEDSMALSPKIKKKYVLKKRIIRPINEEDLKPKTRIITLAKKLIKEKDDGEPLPGSVEEDLATSPENYFDVKDDRILGNMKPQFDENGKLKPWSVCGPVELFERQYENQENVKENLEKKLDLGAFQNLKTKFKSGKEMAGGIMKKPKLKAIEVSNEEIEGRFMEIQERIKNQFFAGTEELRRLGFTHRMKTTKDQRILENFQRMNKIWEKQSKIAVAKLNREKDDLITNRIDEYREKVEKKDVLEKATPSEIRHGNQSWYLSLRESENTNEVRHHTLPIAGLWMRVTENPNAQTDIVRKPNAKKGNYKTFNDNPYFKEKYKQESKRINEIVPGKDDEIDGLQVFGKSKFELEYDHYLRIKDKPIELLLNHYLNEDGEGEPDLEEEFLAIEYEKITNY